MFVIFPFKPIRISERIARLRSHHVLSVWHRWTQNPRRRLRFWVNSNATAARFLVCWWVWARSLPREGFPRPPPEVDTRPGWWTVAERLCSHSWREVRLLSRSRVKAASHWMIISKQRLSQCNGSFSNVPPPWIMIHLGQQKKVPGSFCSLTASDWSCWQIQGLNIKTQNVAQKLCYSIEMSFQWWRCSPTSWHWPHLPLVGRSCQSGTN